MSIAEQLCKGLCTQHVMRRFDVARRRRGIIMIIHVSDILFYQYVLSVLGPPSQKVYLHDGLVSRHHVTE
jgi:hypothetical protein